MVVEFEAVAAQKYCMAADDLYSDRGFKAHWS